MSKPSIRAQLFLQILSKAHFGRVRVEFPDGKVEVFGEGEPFINVQVKRWEVIDLLFSKGDLGLAEAIIEGDLVVDDIALLIEWACRNDQALGNALHGSWYGTLLSRLRHLLNYNDKKGAKKNILAHYDLGNDFYRLWLDPSMTYSSAIFHEPTMALDAAQKAKYDRIIEALDIKSGDHVLEIGCGWGGFFSHAVQKTGCKVTAVMNSDAQALHNQNKIKDLQLGSHVNLQKMDYRDIGGKYDKVVSIEMVEAVGEKYWKTYFDKVSSSLKPDGASLIQGITIREDLFYSYRKQTDFIQQYVFPGGMLLTNNTFASQGARAGMNLADTFEFGDSYAETLRRWRLNFHAVKDSVFAMGFDERFFRLWDLYLAYCEGAFRAGRIGVGQFTLEKS